MAVKIRLMRLGKIRAPHYRVVVADSRTKRDGKVIETIGKYHPKEDPSYIEIDSDRAQYWLSVGAQPSEAVMVLLKLTGDYQRSKGEPAENRVRVAAPKPDHRARYEAEAAQAFEVKEAKVKQDKAAKDAAKAEKKTKKAAAKDTEAAPAAETKATETAAAPEAKAAKSEQPADAPTEA